MDRIKIIENTRKGMQRIAFLKLTCNLIRNSEDTINNFSRKLLQTVSKKITISVIENREIVESLFRKRLNSSPKYKSINWIKVKSILNGDIIDDMNIDIEIQDLYLSSSLLNSNTGSIYPDGYTDIATLAMNLNLVKSSMVLKTRGILIKNLSLDIVDYFKSFKNTNNPFLLQTNEKIIFLYIILSEDYDFLRHLIPKLAKLEKFNIENSATIVSDSIDECLKSFSKYILSAKEKDFTNKLQKSSNSIRFPKGKISGTGRAIYQIFLPRIELLTDLDIFCKRVKESYEYYNTQTSIVLSRFLESFSQQELIRDQFFKFANECFNLNAEPINDRQEAIENLKKNTNYLTSQVGFVPIEELIILTNTNLLFNETSKYMEIKSGIEFIKSYQQDNPQKINFAVDRQGKLVSLKFN